MACHRDRVQAVEDRLAERGADYFDPYSKRVVRGGKPEDNVSRLAEYISRLSGAEVADAVKMLLRK